MALDGVDEATAPNDVPYLDTIPSRGGNEAAGGKEEDILNWVSVGEFDDRFGRGSATDVPEADGVVVGASGEQVGRGGGGGAGTDVVLVGLEGEDGGLRGDVPVVEERIVGAGEEVKLVGEAGETDEAGGAGVGAEEAEGLAGGGVEDVEGAGV